MKGTFDLLVASGTLWRPYQCNPCSAHLRAKSQHPDHPRVSGQGWRGADTQSPSATSPWPVPSSPLASSPAPFQDAQPASRSKERWPDTDLDFDSRNDLVSPLSDLVFSDDVLGIFVVVVMAVDAASFPRGDGASGHGAVCAGFPQLCSVR